MALLYPNAHFFSFGNSFYWTGALVTSVSEEKGNKVVLVTFPRDDVPEIVYTVTQATIDKPRFGGSQPLKIAEKTANGVKNVLIQAWQERQSPDLISQTQRALLVLVFLAFTSLILIWIQKRLDLQKRRLQNSLSKAQSIQPQINSTSNPSKRRWIQERILYISSGNFL